MLGIWMAEVDIVSEIQQPGPLYFPNLHVETPQPAPNKDEAGNN